MAERHISGTLKTPQRKVLQIRLKICSRTVFRVSIETAASKPHVTKRNVKHRMQSCKAPGQPLSSNEKSSYRFSTLRRFGQFPAPLPVPTSVVICNF